MLTVSEEEEAVTSVESVPVVSLSVDAVSSPLSLEVLVSEPGSGSGLIVSTVVASVVLSVSEEEEIEALIDSVPVVSLSVDTVSSSPLLEVLLSELGSGSGLRV